MIGPSLAFLSEAIRGSLQHNDLPGDELTSFVSLKVIEHLMDNAPAKKFSKVWNYMDILRSFIYYIAHDLYYDMPLSTPQSYCRRAQRR